MIDTANETANARTPNNAPTDGPEGIRCDAIDTVAGIDAIRDAWKSLQASLQLPFAKNDVDYFVADMTREAAAVSPCVLVVSDRNVPKLIVVACVKSIRFKPHVGYFPVGLLGRKPKKCLHVLPYGVLGDQDERYSRPLVATMLALLRKKSVDYVYISLLSDNSPVLALARSMPPLLCRDFLPSFEEHYTLNTPENLAAFLDQKGNKTRRRLLGVKKKLSETFGNTLTVRWYAGVDEVDEFCSQAEKVAQKSYHRAIGVGFMDSADTRRKKKFEAEKGWFCSCIMFVNDRPITFHSGIKYGPSFFGETMAFDPAMKEFNPGTALNLDLVDKMSRDKSVRIIDFGFGPDEYKRRFGTDFRREVSVRIFAPFLQGYSMNALATVCEGITRGGRSIARRSGMYTVLKKTVRKLLSKK
jgi:Acetyltransferase (GNAT) domain